MNEFIKKGEKLLRDMCLARAGYKCEICNHTHGLDCHHLLPKSVYPQHRLNPMNIVVACRMKCHVEAEDFPQKFLQDLMRIKECGNRVVFALANMGVNKYPTEVDYEAQYNLLTQQENIFGV